MGRILKSFKFGVAETAGCPAKPIPPRSRVSRTGSPAVLNVRRSHVADFLRIRCEPKGCHHIWAWLMLAAAGQTPTALRAPRSQGRDVEGAWVPAAPTRDVIICQEQTRAAV